MGFTSGAPNCCQLGADSSSNFLAVAAARPTPAPARRGAAAAADRDTRPAARMAEVLEETAGRSVPFGAMNGDGLNTPLAAAAASVAQLRARVRRRRRGASS